MRFGQAGSANGFAWAAIGYGLLSAITFGWYTPAADLRLWRRLWRETYFGDRRFEITHPDEGLAAPLYPVFALAWFGYIVGYGVFLAILTSFVDMADPEAVTRDPVGFFIGIYGGLFAFLAIFAIMAMPYFAALLRRRAEIIGFEGVRFRFNARWPDLLWIFFTNFLIVVITLGFGLAYTQLRLSRYLMNRLEAEGGIDFAAIAQNADKGPKSGEGLADAFDIGGWA